MTNYNLEEFQAWIAANPSQEGGFANWTSLFHYFTNGRESFAAIAEGTPKMAWNPLHLAVIKKWIAEVNSRERERERESQT